MLPHLENYSLGPNPYLLCPAWVQYPSSCLNPSWVLLKMPSKYSSFSGPRDFLTLSSSPRGWSWSSTQSPSTGDLASRHPRCLLEILLCHVLDAKLSLALCGSCLWISLWAAPHLWEFPHPTLCWNLPKHFPHPNRSDWCLVSASTWPVPFPLGSSFDTPSTLSTCQGNWPLSASSPPTTRLNSSNDWLLWVTLSQISSASEEFS